MNLQPAIDHLRGLAPRRETRVGVALDDVADALSICMAQPSIVMSDVVGGRVKPTKTHFKDFADTPQAKEVRDPGGPYKAIGLGNVQSGHQTLRNTWAVWGFAQEMYRKHGDSAERRCRYIAAILNSAYSNGKWVATPIGNSDVSDTACSKTPCCRKLYTHTRVGHWWYVLKPNGEIHSNPGYLYESMAVRSAKELNESRYDRSTRIVSAAEQWAAEWGSTIPAHPLQKALWEACQ